MLSYHECIDPLCIISNLTPDRSLLVELLLQLARTLPAAGSHLTEAETAVTPFLSTVLMMVVRCRYPLGLPVERDVKKKESRMKGGW